MPPPMPPWAGTTVISIGAATVIASAVLATVVRRHRHHMRVLQKEADLPRRRARHLFHHPGIDVRVAVDDADPLYAQHLRERQFDAR